MSEHTTNAAPVELSDERIDAIADIVVRAMPDGVRGFMKAWGWRQFARALLEDCRGHARAESSNVDDEFKNFHRLLCARFGYRHDPDNWRRDQLSLIEWIANCRDRLAVQVKMADERGDSAMRRAHAAEARVEELEKAPPEPSREPIGWLRPSGIQMLLEGSSACIYAHEGDSNHSVPVHLCKREEKPA